MKPTRTEPQIEKAVEQLTADEWTHHKWLIAEIDAKQVALRSWSQYLSQKYQLKQGDSLGANGEIVRAS